ncbi:MAG: MFS transporter [Gammaproteobacteria bacterium]|nr:MFS transporter [Gammaproteobacteria bacterium]
MILLFVKHKEILSWALYDWANSAYATTVMAGFFPLFFKQYWAVELSDTESTFQLGLINSIASIIIVLLAPILGAIADCGGTKKRFLIFFAFLGALMTCALYLVAKGDWQFAVILYAGGILGFSGSNVFYDALLIDVAERQQFDQVSAYGFALGYLGGGLLFTINVLMTLYPQWFGLADITEAVRVSFLSVAVWWAFFTIPLILFVHEKKPAEKRGWFASIGGGLAQIYQTGQEIRNYHQVLLFLVAYWLYIDGVDTIVRMAVDYGLTLGFGPSDLMTALLITQFVGFPATLLFGLYGRVKGPKQGIMLAIFIYLLVLLWAYQMERVWEFYALAVAIGLVQGGIQTLSRSLYAGLIPADKAGEFFGFYNLLGKFAAVIGPILVGWVGVMTGSHRIAILSLALLFIIGAVFLARVDTRH